MKCRWLAYGLGALLVAGTCVDTVSAAFGPGICQLTRSGTGNYGAQLFCEYAGPLGTSFGKAIYVRNWGGYDSLHADHLSGPGIVQASAKRLFGAPTPWVWDAGQSDGSNSVSWPSAGDVREFCCTPDNAWPSG